VFNTNLTTQMTSAFVLFLPKLFVAAVILLVGLWLSQYLGRSTLVWSVNEGCRMRAAWRQPCGWPSCS
jgi:hypothetical protein